MPYSKKTKALAIGLAFTAAATNFALFAPSLAEAAPPPRGGTHDRHDQNRNHNNDRQQQEERRRQEEHNRRQHEEQRRRQDEHNRRQHEERQRQEEQRRRQHEERQRQEEHNRRQHEARERWRQEEMRRHHHEQQQHQLYPWLSTWNNRFRWDHHHSRHHFGFFFQRPALFINLWERAPEVSVFVDVFMEDDGYLRAGFVRQNGDDLERVVLTETQTRNQYTSLANRHNWYVFNQRPVPYSLAEQTSQLRSAVQRMDQLNASYDQFGPDAWEGLRQRKADFYAVDARFAPNRPSGPRIIFVFPPIVIR